jgi:phage terminase large subunit
VFYRKRDACVEWRDGNQIQAGKTNVFIMDWSDHPEKTEEWYQKRRQKATGDGLLHVFAREIERNYAASVEGVIIKPEWVQAAIDAHIHLDFESTGSYVSGLDVGDEGLDTNAQSIVRGPILHFLDEWAQGDTGTTARRAVTNCQRFLKESSARLDFEYDCIGVGAGVKSETNRLRSDNVLPKNMKVFPWHAGAAVKDPGHRVVRGDKESPLNKDFYQNFKAQAWWSVARRFENTYRARYEKDFAWVPDDLVSLPTKLGGIILKLAKELSQPVMVKSSSLKLMIQKKPDGAKSPNLADSYIMANYPATLGQQPTISTIGPVVING